MCLVKKPKIPAPATDAQGNQKPLPILRNPILDGMLGDIGALRAGTSAFRIDLLNPLTIPGGPRAGATGSGAGGGASSGGGGSSSVGASGGGSGGTSTSGSRAAGAVVRDSSVNLN